MESTLQIRLTKEFKNKLERLALANGFVNQKGEANISNMIRTEYQQKVNKLENILINVDEFYNEFIPVMSLMFEELINSQKDMINSDEYEIGIDDMMLSLLNFISDYIMSNQDALLSSYMYLNSKKGSKSF